MPMEWETVRTNAAQYFGFDQLVRGFGPNDILNLSTDSQALYVGPMDWSWGPMIILHPSSKTSGGHTNCDATKSKS